MAKLKKEFSEERTIGEILKDARDKEMALPFVAECYYVDEVTPSHDNIDDVWQAGSRRTVSPVWDSRKFDDPKAEAEKWVSEHEPDEGGWGYENHFSIQRRVLRTHTENKWGYI